MAKLAPGQTLQATALVNEVWMRLDGEGHRGWKSRRHFFAAAATSMRNILVDQARRKQALRRSGAREPALEPDLVPGTEVGVDALDVLALDEALTALAVDFERPARIAQLRFFTGLPIAEIAELEDLDPRTVDRDLLFARTWLRRRL